MNIWVKRAMAAAGITATLVTPISGLASDGTITFTGAVTASTCPLQVNGAGTGDGTVALPTVSSAALTNGAARTTAGGTFFSIGLGTCVTAADILPGPAAPTTVQIYFEAGPNVDQVTGGLINRAASGSNVEVNIYNASAATVVGTQVRPGTNTNQPVAQTIGAEGTQWFYAGYSTAASGGVAATAGAVSTSITYSLIYN